MCSRSCINFFSVEIIFGGGIHFTNKNSVVDSVKLNDVSVKDNLSNLAIMLGDKNNNYTESESSTFPSNEKYSFNPLNRVV